MSDKFTPSDEQNIIIAHFASGRNLKIVARAGAGKSRTLLLCADSDPKISCLALTYNKKLQVDMSATGKRLGIKNIDIRTYHSAAGLAYGRTIMNDVQFLEALKYEPEFIDKLKCDCLMMDETQDMTILYYLFISKLIKHFTKIQVIVVGDPLQSINQFMGSRVEFLINCDKLPGFIGDSSRSWVNASLSTSYRLTPATANFVNRHLGIQTKLDDDNKHRRLTLDSLSIKPLRESKVESKSIGEDFAAHLPPLLIGGNTTSPNIKPRYVAAGFKKMSKDIGKVIKEVIVKYGHENIAIITPSIKSIKTPNCQNPLAVAIREHLVGVPIYIPKDDEMIDDDLVRGKLTVASWNSTKGQERDCVIVVHFDETYFRYFCSDWKEPDTLPNILYVAATRARKELIIMADPAKTLRTIDLGRIAEDVIISEGEKHRLTKSAPPDKVQRSKKKDISVSDLVRHTDTVTMNSLIEMIKVIEEVEVRSPESKTPSADDDTARFTVPFGAVRPYYESVAFLYGLLVPAIVELRRNGSSGFAQKAHIPNIVNCLDDITPMDYCITRKAYDGFPPMFWDALKQTYKVEPMKRKWIEWFRLAIAENIFNENGHHTARQIINYDWIDEVFLEDAIDCVLSAMSSVAPASKFEQKLSREIDNYNIVGVADCVDLKQGEIWEFKCGHKINNDHLMQLACYLALADKRDGSVSTTIGNLYLMLSGKIVRVKLLVPGDEFLRMVLTKFDKKIIRDLLAEISDFKNKLASNVPIVTTSTTTSIPSSPPAPLPAINPKIARYLNLLK